MPRGIYPRSPELRAALAARLAAIARANVRERNHLWRGGVHVNNHGYVERRAPSHPHATCRGYVREHRLVVEARLGRYLLPTEVVHHKNGDKADNRDENLELLATRREHGARHRRPHRYACARCGVRFESRRRRVCSRTFCSSSCALATIREERSRRIAATRGLEIRHG